MATIQYYRKGHIILNANLTVFKVHTSINKAKKHSWELSGKGSPDFLGSVRVIGK